MSIRDLSDSPFPRPRPPNPPPESPSPSEYAEYWAERFAEERRTRDQKIEANRARAHAPPEPQEPRGYRVRSEDVWQAARAEYAAGFSAEAVCAQFDLGLSAFRQRARREGWRKSDAEDALAEPLAFPAEPDAAAPTPELVDLAWRSAAQAIRRGRVYEARAWLRLWESLKAVARNEGMAVCLAEIRVSEAREAAADQEEDKAEDDDGLHGLHSEEGVQSGDNDDAEIGPFDETSASPCAEGQATALKDVQGMLATEIRDWSP